MKIRVVSIGPALSVQGGISRVLGMVKDNIGEDISFRQVATFTQYTGAEGTHPGDRGSKLIQVLVFIWAFIQTLAYACPRQTVFHVHISSRGSLLRKGAICLILRVLQCQFVVHAHGSDIDLFHEWVPQWARRILLWGICGAARFIALSRLWYDQHSASLGLPSSRLLVLPNPANLPSTIPNRMHGCGLKILFLGRICANKGALDTIHAFAGLPADIRKSCHLTLAGDGDVDAAKRLSEELGCSRLVSVKGWVGAAEVDRLLEESDVFALPSYAEGMAMSLLEAMSWGLAVLATPVGAHGEFLESGRNCLLVSPGDIQAISDAICELGRGPDFRIRLGIAARETASRFSIDAYMETLRDLYSELAGEEPRAQVKSVHTV